MEFREDPFGRRSLSLAINNFTEHVAGLIAADARSLCPRNTGKLRSTIVSIKSRVYVGTEYWAHVEYGTRPHVITPKLRGRGKRRGQGRKKALYWPGADHPVAKVTHPGTPEYAFLRRALYKRRGGAG